MDERGLHLMLVLSLGYVVYSDLCAMGLGQARPGNHANKPPAILRYATIASDAQRHAVARCVTDVVRGENEVVDVGVPISPYDASFPIAPRRNASFSFRLSSN